MFRYIINFLPVEEDGELKLRVHITMSKNFIYFPKVVRGKKNRYNLLSVIPNTTFAVLNGMVALCHITGESLLIESGLEGFSILVLLVFWLLNYLKALSGGAGTGDLSGTIIV